jgi:NAD(P)-dependent dehydrogenase (short-subunit alcohol dehydrogenase family)
MKNDKTNELGLRDKVIVVTGATSGFGRGAAIKFAKAGAAVVIAARRYHLLSEVETALLGASGHRGRAVHTDVSKPEDVEALYRATIAEFGRLDVWVNNAGVGALGPFVQVPLSDHEQVVRTNLLGTMYGSWCALRHFEAAGHGILINIASILGEVPSPYYHSYVAAKHGVVGLSASLRQELEERGLKDRIHVCTVIPAAFDTPWFDHAANFTGHDIHPKEAGDPQEVIDVIVRLASHPEDEVTVGKGAAGRILKHNVLPKATERAQAERVHENFMEDAPPAPETHGSLFSPSPDPIVGAGIRGSQARHR